MNVLLPYIAAVNFSTPAIVISVHSNPSEEYRIVPASPTAINILSPYAVAFNVLFVKNGRGLNVSGISLLINTVSVPFKLDKFPTHTHFAVVSSPAT